MIEDRKIAEKLIDQIGAGQIALHQLFVREFDCSGLKLRKIELTYLASSIISYIYLRLARLADMEKILDQVALQVLRSNLPVCGEELTLGMAVEEYQHRYLRYTPFLEIWFDLSPDKDSNDLPMLLVHSFALVTGEAPPIEPKRFYSAQLSLSGFISEQIRIVGQLVLQSSKR